MIERSELIIKWLRQKNYHRNDIASSMAWYKKERESGRKPKDSEVLEVAEKCCKATMVISVRQATSNPVIYKYVNEVSNGIFSPIIVGLMSVISGLVGASFVMWYVGVFDAVWR
jgi:hypothetical protein